MYTLDKDSERYISDSKSYEFGEIYLTEGGYITIINPQDIEVEYRITNYTNYYFSMGTDHIILYLMVLIGIKRVTFT